jgi:hypothetical protein
LWESRYKYNQENYDYKMVTTNWNSSYIRPKASGTWIKVIHYIRSLGTAPGDDLLVTRRVKVQILSTGQSSVPKFVCTIQPTYSKSKWQLRVRVAEARSLPYSSCAFEELL